MKLYDYAASGNCYKVRLLLALLGTPYTRVPVDIFAGKTLGDGYGRINPVRETPVLELGSGEVVTQSNAILWLLLARHAAFPPSDRPAGAAGTRAARARGARAARPPATRSRVRRGHPLLDRRPLALGLRARRTRGGLRPVGRAGRRQLAGARRGAAGLRQRPRAASAERAGGSGSGSVDLRLTPLPLPTRASSSPRARTSPHASRRSRRSS